MISLDNIYARQKLALFPFTENFSETALFEKFDRISNQEQIDFLIFLLMNNLGPAWLEQLGRPAIERLWTTENAQKLQNNSRHVAIRYLQHKAAVKEVSGILENNSIPHAVFKGAHTRELVYPKPATRPSADIDILINEKDRPVVCELLIAQGYTLHTIANILTHEASLIKGNASIDLHWHILRPGRIPKTLTSELLANRTKHSDYWSFSNEENLFILLIHPVFSKYSSTTQSGLIRILDLIFWLRTQPVDWEKLYELLTRTGLRTAAWITLEYLHILTDVSIPSSIMSQLAPGRVKKNYLQNWIYTDLPARLQKWPFCVKIAFTLFAHDDIVHASRFLQILYSDKLR